MQDIFEGKKIIVGVTGGIAAYKAAILIRQLVSRGAEVKVLMTPAATEFIAPLTLSTLSGNDVIINVFPPEQKNGSEMKTWHIDYGIWADLMIIAPATINTIAKIVNGFADNALTTVVAAMRKPVIYAPAADMDMYNKPANKENLRKLTERGSFIVDGEEGFLASGLTGPGRMASVEKIIDAAEIVLSDLKKDLTNKNILVTLGPTFEDIDPVRFIGNRSSGKMGAAIAKAAFLRGANVTAICGPTSEFLYPEIKCFNVRSAAEMQDAVRQNINDNDILIMSAAVADYKPVDFSTTKIKKENNIQEIKLTKTSDILASLEHNNKLIVGFALETDNEIENAIKKMKAKKMEMIVLNSLKDIGAGFEFETNKISILFKNGNKIDYQLQSKFQTANTILTEISNLK